MCRGIFDVRWVVAWLLAVAVVSGCALPAPADSMVIRHQFGRPNAVPEGPTLTLAPTSGPTGTTVTATGSGYQECLTGDEGSSSAAPEPEPGPGIESRPLPRSVHLWAPPPPFPPSASGQVALFWDEVELPDRAELTDDGTFSVRFEVPTGETPGTHTVVSRCADPEDPHDPPILAAASFTVTAPPEVVLVAVPNLVGLPPGDAPAILRRDGLVLGRVSGSGDVIDSQRPPPGTEVRRGSAVDITLRRSPFPQPLVAVPDLVGRTVNEARRALAEVGLVLGNNPDGNRRVHGQTPAARTLVARGTPVTVTVSEAPVSPTPGEPTAGGPVPPVETPTTGQAPPTAEPTPPTSPPPVSPSGATPTTRWWVLLVVAVLILLGVLGGTLARQVRNGPAWVHAHVRAVAGLVPHLDVTVAESRVDEPSRSRVVRIIPHPDRGTQALQVVDR